MERNIHSLTLKPTSTLSQCEMSIWGGGDMDEGRKSRFWGIAGEGLKWLAAWKMSTELQQEKDKLIFFVNCTKHKCGNYGQYLVLIIMNPKFLIYFFYIQGNILQPPLCLSKVWGQWWWWWWWKISHEKPGL